MGNFLIVTGLAIVIVGLLIKFLPGIPLLPGDIFFRKENFTFYFPIATSIIISIILTLIINLFRK